MSTVTNTLNSWTKQYIGGEWQEGNSQNLYTNKNPYDQSSLVSIKLASIEDIDASYKEAQQAQLHWQQRDPIERAEMMKKAAEVVENMREEIVSVLISETGSSAIKANVEVDLVIADIQEFANIPFKMNSEIRSSVILDKENRVYRFPVGVVGVISPFNFPFYLSMRSIAPALAAGNGVVAKPDLQTFISGGLIIAKVFEKAGLPKGLFNVIVADIAEIGDSFVEHPIPKVISFTGSTSVGRRIGELCGKHLKRAALELGGNNVMIVLDDADVSQAASAAVFGKFLHQGQICMSLNRIIVHRNIYKEFVQVFKEKTAMLKAGNPTDPEVFIGPLINEGQANKIKSLVDQSIKEGAVCIQKGKIEGNLIEPIILIDVTNEMAVAKNELFGPVAAILPVDSEEEAIRIANESDFGLSGAVFAGDVEHGVDVALQVHTGMIHVNDQSVNCEPNIPFGGEKSSGLGRFGGEWSLDEFTTTRWVSVQKVPRPFPF